MATLSIRQLGRGMDLGLLTATLLLVLLSLGALFSFSLNVSPQNYSTLYHQLTYAGVGVVVLFLLMRLDYRYLGGIHWVLYGLGVLSLIAVYFFGQTINGTKGWFQFAGFQLQPVEFVKVIMAIVLARYFATHADRLRQWSVIVTSGIIMLIPIILVMMQPDLGSALILIGMWLGLILILPVSRRVIGVIILAVCLISVGSWFVVLKPYQKARIQNLISPERDPQKSGYNVQQAITAIGSGKIWGRGLGLGPQSQLKFLPERQTDFIFASISEELGLIGGGSIILLFTLLFLRLFRLARNSRDYFSSLLTVCLILMFFIQVAINIGMNLGVFPVTGIPLPFVSYGGSSLITSFLAIGILQSLSIRQRTLPV